MLAAIRSEVETNIGKRIIFKADKGRKRIITREGYIDNAFPSLFTIKINNDFDEERLVSYTYSDILTSTVQIKIVS